MGKRTAALHRHYHIPCSNTAIGHLVLRPDNGEGLDMAGSGFAQAAHCVIIMVLVAFWGL